MTTTSRMREVVICCVIPALLAPAAAPLSAATITVDGNCSLVDAVQAANDDRAVGRCTAGEPGGDTLVLTREVTLDTAFQNIDGPNGLPSILTEITIEGNGFSVSRDRGAAEFRILRVAPQGTLELRDLSVTGGLIGLTASLAGGGILNLGELTLRNTTVTSNEANGYFNTPGGGGLANEGYALLVDASVTLNSAFGAAGGIKNEGNLVLVRSDVTDNTADGYGGIENLGELTMIESVVHSNSAGSEGVAPGLGNEAGARATLLHSTISSNFPGGIRNRGAMTLIGSAVIDNVGTSYGPGGILNDATGTLRAIRSTVAGNMTSGDYTEAGGIENDGWLYVESSTISGNVGGGCFFCSGAGLVNRGEVAMLVNSTVVGNDGQTVDQIDANAPVTLANTIVAHTTASTVPNCGGGGGIVDLGGNFSDDESCSGAASIRPGVDFEVDLADNGGPTETHALLSGSVAVDAAVDCTLVADQRGFVRRGPCDSGAYELDGFQPDPLDLRLAGSCPGTMTAEISGAAPNGGVALVRSEPSESGSGIATGVCSGTVLELADPGRVFFVAVEIDGTATFVRTVDEDACGDEVQAVDLFTCAVSNAAAFP